MAEIPDIFFDNIDIESGSTSPIILFGRQTPKSNRVEVVGIGRTSYEHMKLFTYVMCRAVKEAEKKNEVNYQIPKRKLSDLNIAQDDWMAFWRPDANPGL